MKTVSVKSGRGPLLRWLLPLTALSMSLQVAAQQVPPGITPGRVERDVVPEPRPASREGTLTVPEWRSGETLAPEAASIRLTLTAVELRGNQAIATDALADAWQGLLSREVSLADLHAVADAVTARYRAQGYLLAQAYVPAQDLTTADARVRIDVLEGRVSMAPVTGTHPVGDGLRPYFDASLSEPLLRVATLERDLLLANDLPGLKVQASLGKGEAPGTSTLVLDTQQDASAFSLSVHNRTNPAQGEVRLEGSAQFRGVLGQFDSHDFRFVGSGDRRLALLSYGLELPVGTQGLKLQLSASASRSEPEVPLFNVLSQSENLSIGASYPVLRSRLANLSLRAALGAANSRSQTLNIPTSDDRLRVLRLGLAADHADALDGIFILDAELSQGLGGLGASSRAELNGAEPEFTKGTVYLARLQNLGLGWSVLAALSAQDSNDVLSTAEQMGLGGEVFLRAFDPSEAIGERGTAGKLELRYTTAASGFSTTFYAYFDAGRVSRRQIGGADLDTSLKSAGIGWRFTAPYGLRGYLEVAKPGGQPVASQGDADPRFFAGLGIDF